ncbi:MAG: TonB-dependent receptor [Acidobacteria bacterium]|nr:TonB-dependent receptor [Acidobacteriota bacterium]
MKQRFPFRMLVLTALMLAAEIVAFGQTSQITGRITDPRGAVVPGVQVVVTNNDNRLKRETTSSEEGYYTIPVLQPGNYQISIQKAGFKSINQSGIHLLVQQVARLDFTLEIGETTEEVNITAEGPLLETETSSLGKVVNAQRIRSLPLLGRNPYSLVALVPGARPSAGLNDLPVDQVSTASVSINGARGNQNEYLLDGAPNAAAAGNQPVIFASPDTVQEFRIETNSYSAQFGRAAGGVFNVVTKSGTNELHGTAYNFLRNDLFNANNFFSNREGIGKPSFRFNQFGGTVGGPLLLPRIYDGRKRSYFFAGYEGVRFSQGGTFVGTVPTLLQREGNFSQTRDAGGRLIQIFNPLTTRQNPNNSAQFIRDPFPGNIVPRSLWDPVALRMLAFIPLPNATGNPVTGTNNYVTNAATRIQKDTFSVRFDHSLTDAQRLTGRYSYDRTPVVRPNVYGSIASPTAGPQVFTRQNLVLDHTVTYNPAMVGSILYSFTRLSNFRHPLSFGFDMAILGFPAALKDQLFPPSFPYISITGMGGTFSIPNTGGNQVLGGHDLIAFGDNTHALLGHITRVFTRHTLKFGGEGRLLRPNYLQTGNAIQFSFAPAFTQGPDPTRSSPTAGIGFASFLLGVGSGSYTTAPALALQHLYWGVFVQDDLKLTSKLTLNLGLRHEYESPRTERFNQLANFDPQLVPPLQVPEVNLRGALAFPGVDGRPRQQWDPDHNNFAPRIGFAYQLTPKTVIRGGAGIFYAAITGIGGFAGSFGTSGFQANTTVVTSLDGVTPITFLDNPYPGGINQPTGSRLGLATLLGQSINFTDRNIRTPYSEQWNLNLQRELPWEILLEIGYAGNRGLKLQENLTLNQLPDSALALGNALNELVPNPFFGQIASGPLSSRTVARAQLLRPYPQFDSITATNSTWTASSYHALVVSADRRFSRGLAVMASYSFSKLIDQATGAFTGEVLGGGAIQDYNNLRSERSISSLDAPHRLVISGIYSLPYGAGKRWRPLGNASVILSGWELSSIATFQSGGPLGITSASNTTFSRGGGQRPNLTGISPQLSDGERSVTRWINPAAFTAPPPFTFGNAPRTFGNLRSDGVANVDLAVVKNTRLVEQATLQFRGEFFNLLNTPRFAPPNTSFGSPLFGTVNNQANQPRVIQFALKLIY